MIDPRAAVDPKAQIDESAHIAPFAVIGPNVKIGPDVKVGPNATIYGHTTIGAGCEIFPHAAVGFRPQDLKYKGEPTTLEVGERTVIREFASLHTGTVGGGGKTKVGSDCLIMGCAHVAHDCIVGNNVILANSSALAGHVTVEDHVILGGLSGVHQFARLGKGAIIGGGSVVLMDVPPFVTAAGNKARLAGLNLIGLKRGGMDKGAIKALRAAYRAIFQSKETLSKSIENLRSMDEYAYDEVKYFVDFIGKSERGVTR